ncbi:MAG: isopentenyl-diphosphate Delta-isomerase [Nocardioidaceae bacterium]
MRPSYPGAAGAPSRITAERVVLLDEAGRAVGEQDKQAAHSTSTPLHLAFSCYVFDSERRLLVTRRALDKRTFPGAWTNTACGHPGPGERLLDAVTRRVREELGIGLRHLRIVLPRFRYRAVMANGIIENEMCPVSTALTEDEPVLDPDEVAATTWVPWDDFSSDVLDGRREVSPWCLEQVRELALLAADPLEWAAASSAALPPAARLG